MEQSEHVPSVVASPLQQQQQPSQSQSSQQSNHRQQQQQQQQQLLQSLASLSSVQAADANLTYSAETAREVPVYQSEKSQHFDVPAESVEFVSEEMILNSKHRGRSNPNLNRLRPSSARVIPHPTYTSSTSSPSPLMKSSSAVSGRKELLHFTYLL